MMTDRDRLGAEPDARCVVGLRFSVRHADRDDFLGLA